MTELEEPSGEGWRERGVSRVEDVDSGKGSIPEIFTEVQRRVETSFTFVFIICYVITFFPSLLDSLVCFREQ